MQYDLLFAVFHFSKKEIALYKYTGLLAKPSNSQDFWKTKFKVACLGNLKLAFTGWFFYNLVMLINLNKFLHRNVDKALLFLINQVICLKNWKLWRDLTTIKFNIFCWNCAHISFLTISTKMYSRFFLFCSDLQLLIKM